MADYWHFIDRVWIDTPEYAGCGFGYLRRWNRKNMARARQLMDKACQRARGTGGIPFSEILAEIDQRPRVKSRPARGNHRGR